MATLEVYEIPDQVSAYQPTDEILVSDKASVSGTGWRTIIEILAGQNQSTLLSTLDTPAGRSGLTINVLPKADANGDLVNSLFSDDGATATVTGPLDVTDSVRAATLTVDSATQLVNITGEAQDLLIKGATSASDFFLELASADNNNSDDVGILIDNTGTISTADRESLFVGFNSGTLEYNILAQANGSGTVRAIDISSSAGVTINGVDFSSSGAVSGVTTLTADRAFIGNSGFLALQPLTVETTVNTSDGEVTDDRKGTIHLQMVSGGTQGDGLLGPGISLSGINTGRRRGLIACYQDGTDPDVVGLKFFTSPIAGTAFDQVSLAMTLRAAGDVELSQSLTAAGKIRTTSTAADSISTLGGIEAAGNVVISSTTATLVLEESDGTAGLQRNWLARSADDFFLQTRAADDTLVSTDYKIDGGGSGGFRHTWFVNGVARGTLEDSSFVFDGPDGSEIRAETASNLIARLTAGEDAVNCGGLEYDGSGANIISLFGRSSGPTYNRVAQWDRNGGSFDILVPTNVGDGTGDATISLDYDTATAGSNKGEVNFSLGAFIRESDDPAISSVHEFEINGGSADLVEFTWTSGVIASYAASLARYEYADGDFTSDGTDFEVTIGVIMSALPTSNPGGSGQLWNDAGTVKIT